MQIQDVYQVVVTAALQECRDFYRHWFDFEVAFESSWFVLMSSNGEELSFSVAFIHPDHPSAPPSPGVHGGNGSFLTLQVEDAATEYETLIGRGLRCELELTDEPWGQRRFGVIDPAGMWVDVVEPIDPEPGWWDSYTRESTP
jgi:uncharacterized glyoxalase superfamily protein PhnB